jgi:pSer/pThr/pTyr-binding forkhead associated (FHA) protein
MIRLLLEHEGARTELSIEASDAVIGRSSSNAVPIADRRLSRTHARIERDDLGYVLRDLGSANGTWLNRRRVSSERLVQGDEIRVGRTVIHVLALARIS